MAGARLEQIIKTAVKRGASDLHIKAGDVFRARIDGKLVPLTKQRLTPDQTRAIASRFVGTEAVRARLDEIQDYDCSWGLPGVGRFRINILRQRSSYMVVMRVIPFTLPTFESLELPPVVEQLSTLDAGLLLISGVSGSGKSSTVAAIVNHINQNFERHIIIVEDPIEFLHRDLKSSITQREVGVDTETTEVGLRAALRQDPDVIVLGDLVHPEVIDLAIKGGETGRLVIGVMPTHDVVSTIAQLLAMLPGQESEIGRVRFGAVLGGVIAQQLLPRKGGQGRVVAVEALTATKAVKALLQNPSKPTAGVEAIMAGGKEGMSTFAASATALQASGAISKETAKLVGGPGVPRATKGA